MKEFLDLVKNMRQAQINHQRFNSTMTAFKSINLELRVDQLILIMLEVIKKDDENKSVSKAKKELGYQQ